MSFNKKNNNIEDFVSILTSIDSNDDYFSFLDKVAPAFSLYLVNSFIDSKTWFEDNKHHDINKYLYDPFMIYTKNFGKLHRPLTTILSYLVCLSGDIKFIDEVISVASSIEHFQNAALIHDDIADKGELRRGVSCLHKQIGEGLAINAGDYGLSMVVGNVLRQLKGLKFSDAKILSIIEKLTLMEYMTIEGQAMDLGWARYDRFDISESDYVTMATKKSAYYSAAIPAVIGAICADATEVQIEAMQNFGLKVGLAFQIKDDILNVDKTNNKAALQKDFLSDISEGKRTLAVVKTLEFTNLSEKNRFIEILRKNTSNAEEKLEAAKIMIECGALDYCSMYANKLSEDAKLTLKDKFEDSIWYDILISMADWAGLRSC